MKSVELRNRLVDVLRLDLVGPEPGSPLESELLPTAPSRWYLTGFLIPFEAPDTQRADETADDQLDLIPTDTGFSCIPVHRTPRERLVDSYKLVGK